MGLKGASLCFLSVSGVALPRHPVSGEPLWGGAADGDGPALTADSGRHAADHAAGRTGPADAALATGQDHLNRIIKVSVIFD